MKASIVVHEHPDGGYFVGTWSQSHAQWQRPLDAETKKLTGCLAEYQQKPFYAQATLKRALEVARSLYGEIEDDVSCNGGQSATPCPAALADLRQVSGSWRGVVTCPICGASWRGDYYALNRWPGDTGSAFDWRLERQAPAHKD